MKRPPEDIGIAEKMFDLMLKKDGVKVGAPVKVYDYDGKLIDFGFVTRIYYDRNVSMFRVGVTSAMTARDEYYDHISVSGVA